MGKHGHHGKHDHGHGKHGHHGNPEDLARYLEKLEGADRAEWQQPDRVVEALGLRPGQVVADVGAGPGYFTLRLARAVGPAGRVFAVDAEPKLLEVLRERVQAAGAGNVTPVLGLDADPLLPPGSVDLALVVDAYHHLAGGPAYLRKLAGLLKPGGRIANVDWRAGELELGPPPEIKVSREAFLRDAEAAGLRLEAEHTFLVHQYFLVLRPA